MSQDQRSGYLDGLVGMLAYQTAVTGNKKMAVCISDTFYRERQKEAWKRLYEVMDKYSDRQPEILVTALAKQLCKD